MRIEIPISVGELVDRITILRLKKAGIPDRDKLANVVSELERLESLFERRVGALDAPEARFQELHETNARLWEIEDELRDLERARDFGARFVEAARQVYRLNDRRYRLKRAVSEHYGSEVREEKSHVDRDLGAPHP